jgi:dTDP-4-dehydrorhamnose reductase
VFIVRLLVTGASGYVGRHVCRHALASDVSVVGTYLSRPLDILGVEWLRLDVTSPGAVLELMRAVEPDVVIHTAYAHTPSLDPISTSTNWTVNALGAIHVARAAEAVGARLVHVSTDAVHNGRDKPFTEADAPSPVYPYGAAKAAAEVGVYTLAPSAVIARVSLINSDVPSSGELSVRERFMLDLITGRVSGVLFTDDIRCPIAVTDLAEALLELATTDYAGVINVAGPDPASFYDLGVLVARKHGLDPAAIPSSTIAASMVSRPGNVQLDTSLAASLLRTRLRGVRELFE